MQLDKSWWASSGFPQARRAGLIAVTTLALGGATMGITGCGGDDDSSDAAATEASAPAGSGGSSDALAKAAEDAKKASTTDASFEPWDPGAGPTPKPGAKVSSITCLQVVPSCKRMADGAESALKAIGWTGKAVDGTGDPNNFRTVVQSFLTRGVDGFFLQAIDPNTISDILKEANSREIPWTGSFSVDNEPFGGPGPSITGTGGNDQAGKDLAAWVANDSQGKGKIVVLQVSGNDVMAERLEAFKEYMEAFPEIEVVDGLSVPLSEIGPPVVAKIQSVLQRYPQGDLDYIWTPFDGFATFAVEATQSAGRDDAKILGFDGDPAVFDSIREGTGVAATLASAMGWCAWATVDAVNRLMNDAPYGDPSCPTQVIDKTNVPESGAYDGNFDYQTAFKKIWSADS